MTYPTLDYLPDLTAYDMTHAGTLTFATAPANDQGWDVYAYYASSAPYAILRDTFKWTGVAGATYDMESTSYFDPFLIQVYDQYGNVIRVNDDPDYTYGSDFVVKFVAPYSGTYYVSAGWDQGSYYTSVSLIVAADLDTAKRFQSGTAGNDTFQATGYLDQIDGGAGRDTVIESGPRSGYVVQYFDGAPHVTKVGDPAPDVLFAVERIKFDDVYVAFDIAGDAGQAYRMYQAAFNRTPDTSGLGFWIKAMDNGVTLTQVAAAFISSAEFQATYGNLDNAHFAAQLYQNVLHRAPDASGLAFWEDVLDSGTASRPDVLAGFSESTENQANVIGQIFNGIVYA